MILVVATIAGCNLVAQNADLRYGTVSGEKNVKSGMKISEKPIVKAMPDNKDLSTESILQKERSIRVAPNNSPKSINKTDDRQHTFLETKDFKFGYTTKKTKRDDVATVTLKVIGDPTGNEDGSGYQLLLDEHCLMYEYIWSSGFIDNDFYNHCEYKIPENASMEFDNNVSIVNSQGSVIIPNGNYDFFVLFLIKEWGYISTAWFPQIDDWATINNFHFSSGYEYIFTIEIWNDVVFEPEHDAKLTDIILPPFSGELTNNEEISVVIMNNGIEDITGEVELSYKINNGNLVTETVPLMITPGGELSYSFTTTANFSEVGFYKIEAFINYELDFNPFENNNSIVGYTKKNGPLELPLIENFDDETSLIRYLTVVDANEDGLTWMYNNISTDADGETGCLQINSPRYSPWNPDDSYPADDYLITDPLIFSETGSYNLTFWTRPFSTDEKLRVLYGTGPNPDDMILLKNYIMNVQEFGYDWSINIINFEIETPDNYYFAFHYNSFNNDGMFRSLYIDKIKIEDGIFVGVPDITINKVFVPLSGCDLQNEVIGLDLFNKGTEPIHEFTITYSINQLTTVTQTFFETIGMKESTTVFFDQHADFSNVGEYNIKFTASTPNEENTGNNEMEITLKHFSPITEIPFISNFSNEEDIADWYPAIEGAWINNSENYYVYIYNVPLLSRCIKLEQGMYRFTYNYRAGGLWWTSDFYITYGKTGTDPYTWEPVKEHYNCSTNGVVEDNFIFYITEAGNYMFEFFPLSDLISVFYTSVSIVNEHDFRINNIELPSSLTTRMTPIIHASNEQTFIINVENRGATPNENGNIKLLLNDNEIASNNFSFIEVGEVKKINFIADFGTISEGELKIKFNVSLESGLNEAVEFVKIVTDSTFAWDYIDTEFFSGYGFFGDPGAGEPPFSLGMIYELQKTDILTSITVGLYEYEQASNSNIGLSVYPVFEYNELGEELFYVEYPRTIGNNEQGITFRVPETELLPGKYYFDVRQLDENNVAVAFDNNEKGYFYIFERQWDYISTEYGYGYLHIRPNFGNPLVGIEELRIKNYELRIYPNPVANGELKLRQDQQPIEKITVFNTAGQVVMSVSDINSASYSINTEKFRAGLYFISVQTKDGVVNEKFVVK